MQIKRVRERERKRDRVCDVLFGKTEEEKIILVSSVSGTITAYFLRGKEPLVGFKPATTSMGQ